MVDVNKCTPPEGKLTPAQMRQLGIVSDGSEEQVRALANYFNRSKGVKTRDVLQEIYVNGLLSRPATFVANIGGTGASIFASITERAYAGLVNKVFHKGDVNGVQLQEAFDLASGYMHGLKESFHLFGKIMRNKDISPELAMKTDFMPRDRALRKESFGASGIIGDMIDLFGTFVNIPGRLLLSTDTVMKEMIKKGEIAALSRRESFKQFSDQFGRIPNSAEDNLKLTEIFEGLLAKPSADIKEAAEGFGKVVTFTNDLGDQLIQNQVTKQIDTQPTFSKSMNNVLESDPTGILKIFIPFFKTPLQLLNFVGDRTPFVRKIGGNYKYVAAHGTQAQKELLQAKLATGMGLYSIGIMAAMEGKLVGNLPTDPQMRKNYEIAGVQTDSVFVAGQFVPFNRFDPIGAFLGLSAVMGRFAKSFIDLSASGADEGFRQEHFDKYQEVFSEAVTGLSHVILDRHYLSGISQVLDTLMLDPHAVGKTIQTGATWISGAGLYGSLRRGITKELDPRKRFTDKGLPPVFEEGDDQYDVAKKKWVQVMNQYRDEIEDAWFKSGEQGRPVKLDREGNEIFAGGYSNQDLYTEAPNAMAKLFQIGEATLKGTFAVSSEFPYVDGNLLKPSRITKPRTDSVVDQKVIELGVTIDLADSTEDIHGVRLTDEERDFFQKSYGAINKKYTRPRLLSKDFNNQTTNRQAEELKTELTRNRRDAKADTLSQFPRIEELAYKNEDEKNKNRERDQIGNTQADNIKKMFNPKKEGN